MPQPLTPPTSRHRSSRGLAGLELADILSRNWWVLLLRGLIAIAFGVLALRLSRTSLSVLVWPFGIYTFVDGILGVGIAIGEPAGRRHWWALFFWGLIGISTGILTYFAPARTLLVFLLYIAAWAAAAGVLEILTAIYLRRKLGDEWLLVLAGLVSCAFGVLLIALSGAGAFVLSRLIAVYAIVLGVILGVLALRARTAPLPSA